MMTDTVISDPYDFFFGDDLNSLSPEDLLFSNEIMFTDFNNHSQSTSPIQTTNEITDTDFDSSLFDKIVNDLFSSDPAMLKEQSIDLTYPLFETESPTREIGTDPMEPSVPQTTLPLIIKTTDVAQFTPKPIILIQSTPSTKPIDVSNEYFNITTDYSMEDALPLTPSTSNDSTDERNTNSPDSIHESSSSSAMFTDLENLPSSGKLVLTREEVKLIKQEGYEVPTKLPLSKADERMLKKIRRKIKNKISAQESRRKKKEYVDALEKEIAKYVDENKALKQRMTAIEKNQKTLTQERDLLRNMIGKNLPAPTQGTALMVFAVFFAVLFGVWSPLTNKNSTDERALSLIPAHNYQSVYQQQSNSIQSEGHKSRVLLSIDDYDQYQHGPYLPSNNKYKSSVHPQIAAPGYTYSNTVEKYMNKKVKRSSSIDSEEDEMKTVKKIRPEVNENFVIIEEIDSDNHENKSVKIIRVERTIPSIGNDTLKLAHRDRKSVV